MKYNLLSIVIRDGQADVSMMNVIQNFGDKIITYIFDLRNLVTYFFSSLLAISCFTISVVTFDFSTRTYARSIRKQMFLVIKVPKTSEGK